MLPVKKDIQEYDYAIEIVYDNNTGGANIPAMENTLKRRAATGWRLVTAFTNELGKVSESFAGYGTNATIDQTILIFEKRVYNPELEALEQLNREYRNEVDIIECNMVEPIFPKTITLITKGNETSVSISVQTKTDFIPKGLQGNLTVYNVFGDSILLEDVCFFNFEAQSNRLYNSDAFPVTLPDKISRGIGNVIFTVKRYISNEGVCTPDKDELINIRESLAEKRGMFDVDDFLDMADSMNTAKEIFDLVSDINIDNDTVFSDELMSLLHRIVQVERMYGNAKSAVMIELKKYFYQ